MLRRTIPLLVFLALCFAFEGSRPILAQEPAHKSESAVVKPESLLEKIESLEKPIHDQAVARHEPDIMAPKAPLAIWTLIVFIGLMLILGRFAWKPLMKALAEREAHLQNVLFDSERARNEAEAIAAEHRKQLAAAGDQIRAMIEEARKEAQVAAASIITKAQAEVEAARHRAEREIAGAKDQALMEIWSSTADLAVSVAGKVLSKELGEADHRRLVEVAMGELPANGREGSRT
jgi:F-type H+-transporting ATPase subunit b